MQIGAKVKELIKPTVLKLLIFLFISLFYLYFAGEDVCAVGLSFKFCYKAHGFPIPYLVTGDISNASDYIKTLSFSNYFAKFGNYLLNPAALLIDAVLIYLLSCFISMIFADMKIKN